MKNIKIFYSAKNTNKFYGNYWIRIIEWLKLLILSLTRAREKLANTILSQNKYPFMNYLILKNNEPQTNNKTIMKRSKQIIKWCSMLLLLFLFATNASGQGPYPNSSPTQTVCLNGMPEPYGVANVPTSTFSWSISPGVAGTDWTLTSTSPNSNTISILWKTAGVYTLKVVEINSLSCPGDTVSMTITVNPLFTQTISPTICANQVPYIFNGVSYNTSGTYIDTVLSTTGGCDTAYTINLTVNPTPTPVITGPQPTCESVNNSTVTYSTPNVPGNTYTWSLAPDGVIVSGQGTNQITVRWTSPGPKVVTVVETIPGTGCSETATLNVTVTPKPVTTPITHN